MKVVMGQKFRSHFLNFSRSDKEKIADFILHVENVGLENLAGRNKKSDGFSNDDPDFLTKMERVRQHNLWHYHIGIPDYEKASNGELVSEFVLHYIRNDQAGYIKIVDMSDHPPFKLPNDEYLQ